MSIHPHIRTFFLGMVAVPLLGVGCVGVDSPGRGPVDPADSAKQTEAASDPTATPMAPSETCPATVESCAWAHQTLLLLNDGRVADIAAEGRLTAAICPPLDAEPPIGGLCRETPGAAIEGFLANGNGRFLAYLSPSDFEEYLNSFGVAPKAAFDIRGIGCPADTGTRNCDRLVVVSVEVTSDGELSDTLMLIGEADEQGRFSTIGAARWMTNAGDLTPFNGGAISFNFVGYDRPSHYSFVPWRG